MSTFKKLLIAILLILPATVMSAVVISHESFYSVETGGWSWFSSPMAIYSSVYNKTYWGYINNLGDVRISSLNHSSSVRSNFVLHSIFEYDTHDAPCILIRTDGRLIALYAKHTGNNIYYRISTNPGDISSWGAEQTIVLGPPLITYLQISSLPGEANKIYLFFRGLGLPGWSYVYSIDQGNSWSGIQPLFNTGVDLNQYQKSISNGVDRIYFSHSGHPELELSNIYAFYYYNNNFYKSDDTLIGAVPFSRADMTLVYDASAPGNYTAWVGDIGLSSGTPCIAFFIKISPAMYKYMYARWDGASWIVNEITPSPNGAGGISIDKGNPNIVYFSKQINGVWEIQKGVTSDGGATWSITSITSSSPEVNLLPIIPDNHNASIPVLWMRGEHNSYLDYRAIIVY